MMTRLSTSASPQPDKEGAKPGDDKNNDSDSDPAPGGRSLHSHPHLKGLVRLFAVDRDAYRIVAHEGLRGGFHGHLDLFQAPRLQGLDLFRPEFDLPVLRLERRKLILRLTAEPVFLTKKEKLAGSGHGLQGKDAGGGGRIQLINARKATVNSPPPSSPPKRPGQG